MPVRIFTQRNLLTVLALGGLGAVALNMNAKSEAEKRARAALQGNGQSFALGGCERSGNLTSYPPSQLFYASA
ncbi:hypothetical protein RUND412_006618 [Rhizina undulata]